MGGDDKLFNLAEVSEDSSNQDRCNVIDGKTVPVKTKFAAAPQSLDDSGEHSSASDSETDSETEVESTNEEGEASLKELEIIRVIKEKDLAFKQRLSKLRILDTLIGKTGPLPELEITLKNKQVVSWDEIH